MTVRRLFALIAGALVLYASLELIFRIAVFPDWRIVSRVPFEFHPIYGTFQKPNLEVRRYNPPNYDVINRTNSRGFRDREQGFDSDLNALWISGLSNSYGGFLEDGQIYARVLEDRYGYRNALLASEGHTLPNQVAVMRDLHRQGYRPKLVILELTMNNVLRSYRDGIDALKSTFAAPTQKGPATAQPHALESLGENAWRIWTRLLSIDFIGLKARLINNSAVYAWLKVGVNSIPFLRKYTLEIGLRADPALAENIPISMLDRTRGDADEPQVDELADYLVLIRNWVKTTLDADFGAIVIPSKHHLNPDWFARFAASRHRDPATLDPARPYRLLLRALEDRNVATLSMAKPLLASKPFLNFEDDGHLNAAGHAIVASAVADWIRTRFARDVRRDP